MLDWLSRADGILELLAALCAAAAGTWLYLKKVRVKYRQMKAKVNNLYDAVAGAEAIIDPETGRVLKAERLAIGSRVAVIEEWQAQTIHTLQQIAETQGTLARIEGAVADVADELRQHKLDVDKRFVEHGEQEADHRDQLWKAIHKIQDE